MTINGVKCLLRGCSQWCEYIRGCHQNVSVFCKKSLYMDPIFMKKKSIAKRLVFSIFDGLQQFLKFKVFLYGSGAAKGTPRLIKIWVMPPLSSATRPYFLKTENTHTHPHTPTLPTHTHTKHKTKQKQKQNKTKQNKNKNSERS